MGAATLAIAGFTALKMGNEYEQGQSQAKAATLQAKYEAMNSANNTAISAGKVRNSFLSSGISLEGGPMAALGQIFSTGQTNINRIAANGNAASKNAVNSARSAMLQTLSQSASMVGGDPFSSFGSSGLSSGASVGTSFLSEADDEAGNAAIQGIRVT